MAVFSQVEVDCTRCGETYGCFTGMEGFSFMYRSAIFSCCPKCTEEILDLLGVKSVEIHKRWKELKKVFNKSIHPL